VNGFTFSILILMTIHSQIALADSEVAQCVPEEIAGQITVTDVPDVKSAWEYKQATGSADKLLKELSELLAADMKDQTKPKIIAQLEDSKTLDAKTLEVDHAIDMLNHSAQSDSLSNELRAKAYLQVSKLYRIRLMLEMPKIVYFTLKVWKYDNMKAAATQKALEYGTKGLRAIGNAINLGSADAQAFRDRFIKNVSSDVEMKELWAPVLHSEFGISLD